MRPVSSAAAEALADRYGLTMHTEGAHVLQIVFTGAGGTTVLDDDEPTDLRRALTEHHDDLTGSLARGEQHLADDGLLFTSLPDGAVRLSRRPEVLGYEYDDALTPRLGPAAEATIPAEDLPLLSEVLDVNLWVLTLAGGLR